MRMKFASNCLLAVSLCAVLPAHATFKCVDEKGVTHYGDTMPPQCAKNEVTEISKSGSVIRKIDPPYTPEQLKVREEERLKRTEIAQRMAAQRLKDLALLGTYGSEREFDASRDRAFLQLDARVNTLKLRITEVDAQLAKLKIDMEFFEVDSSKAGKSGKNARAAPEVPQRLTQALTRAKGDRSGLEEEIARVEKDKAAVSARYDSDKARWKQMKAGMPPGTLIEASANLPPRAAPAAAAESRTERR